jgi:hypothetical protein
MKTVISAVKITALFVLAGTLFSCLPIINDNYGTLVVALPGASSGTPARALAAVSDGFKGTLSYHIECNGPGGSVSREVPSGASPVIPLTAGDWTVTVTVLNAAGEAIGSASATAAIESGKTTTVAIPITIDTSGKAITRFAVTSPFFAEGQIFAEDYSIMVPVPVGTDCGALGFSVTHTGVSVNPASGPLGFHSPQAFVVTAENGTSQSWTAEVEFYLPPLPGLVAAWPDAAMLAPYGLTFLTQPGTTTIIGSVISSGALIIYLQDAAQTDYDTLVAGIEGGTTGTTNTNSTTSGYVEFERTYNAGGEDFTLEMIFASGTLMLTVTPGDPSALAVWPDDSKWTGFNLAGLTQPAGTVVLDVTESSSPALLEVRLRNVDNASYEDLLAQVTAKFGNPFNTDTSGTTREDTFISSMTPPMTVVALRLDTGDDEITITATEAVPQ